MKDMKSWTMLSLRLAILAVIGTILFCSRHIFFYHYEPEYYENWYYHSQWNIPDSARGISDGEIYKFVGYRLIEGENPFNINYEVPPFAKSLYGLAEKIIGNPYWISIGFYFIAIVALFILLEDLFQDRRITLLGLLLFVVTPFIATQIRETMLDLPLMTLFLIHARLFVRYLLRKPASFWYLSSAGVFLGLATGTKVGLYTIPITVLGMIAVMLYEKSWKFRLFRLVFYLGTIIAGYMLSYYVYFIHHPNPIPWLKLHQKAFDFYLKPVSVVDHWAQWRGIFPHDLRNLQFGKSIGVGDWTPLLPLGVIALIALSIFAIRKRDLVFGYLCGLCSIFLMLNSFVKFFDRYLMPTIPLFIIFILFFCRKRLWPIGVLIAFSLPFFYNSLLYSNPKDGLEATARFTATRAYRELYRTTTPNDRSMIKESDFITLNEQFYETLGTKKIAMQLKNFQQKETTLDVTYQTTYTTTFGVLTFYPIYHYIKIHNQWKLQWHWDYLWPGFGPASQFVIHKKSIPLAAIRNPNGELLAERGEWQMIYVKPRLMQDVSIDLQELSLLTGEKVVDTLNKKIKTTIPDDFPRPLDYLRYDLGNKELADAKTFNYIVFKPFDFIVPTGARKSDTIIKIRSLYDTQPDLFAVEADVAIRDQDGINHPMPFPTPNARDIVITLD